MKIYSSDPDRKPGQPKPSSPPATGRTPVKPAVWKPSPRPAEEPPAAGVRGPALDLGGGIAVETMTVPSGEFRMGSPPSVEGHQVWEGPQHRVRFPKPFLLGRGPVTVRQFRRFVEATGHRTDAEKGGQPFEDGKSGGTVFDREWVWREDVAWKSPGFEQDPSFDPRESDSCPAVLVSWNDASAFCSWASRLTGREVRLPAEAQWEYACRAGATGRYCCGDSDVDLAHFAWHDTNSHWVAHPVCARKPNAWGLCDMHGNVWEWCGDAWRYDYQGAIDDGVTYTTPGRKDLRVLRGGAWCDSPINCRSAARTWCRPEDRRSTFGFRVAVTDRR